MGHDGMSGRMVPLPLNRFGRWKGLTSSAPERREFYDSACAAIRKTVEEVVEQVSRDRSILARWGGAAREHLHALYGVDGQSRALATLYRDALA